MFDVEREVELFDEVKIVVFRISFGVPSKPHIELFLVKLLTLPYLSED